jgi:hypothetical protein
MVDIGSLRFIFQRLIIGLALFAPRRRPLSFNIQHSPFNCQHLTFTVGLPPSRCAGPKSLRSLESHRLMSCVAVLSVRVVLSERAPSQTRHRHCRRRPQDIVHDDVPMSIRGVLPAGNGSRKRGAANLQPQGRRRGSPHHFRPIDRRG